MVVITYEWLEYIEKQNKCNNGWEEGIENILNKILIWAIPNDCCMHFYSFDLLFPLSVNRGLQTTIKRVGAVAHACNPSTLVGWGGWITRSRDRYHPGQHGETPSLLKIQKISWARWRVLVIPATQEAEAGELPEPRRRRLQWAEIVPLHSSLGNKSETLSQKKIKIKINWQKYEMTYMQGYPLPIIIIVKE